MEKQMEKHNKDTIVTTVKSKRPNGNTLIFSKTEVLGSEEGRVLRVAYTLQEENGNTLKKLWGSEWENV